MAGSLDHQWPGPDEKQTVAEMITNPESEHWSACRASIESFVNMNCIDLQSMKEDLVQETILSVSRGLPTFRFDSKLKTWVITITLNRANDLRRKNHKIALMEISIFESDDEDDERVETFQPYDSRTPEDSYLIIERFNATIAELDRFVEHYNKAERNKKILYMCFLEGYSVEEIAISLGMKPPAVNAVIRAARLHLRVWLEEHPF